MKGNGKLWKAVRCAAFLVLLGYLVLHLSYVLRQVPERNAKDVFPAFYAEADNSLDVVTIGSSACYQFIDTPVLYENFGITSFNLGCPIQSTVSTPFLMDEVEVSQSPELFIVEVRRYLKGTDKNFLRALYLMTDTMNFGINKWNMICRGYDSPAKRVQEFLDIWKYHSFWTGLTLDTFAMWNNSAALPSKHWHNRQKVEPQESPVVEENPVAEPLKEKEQEELIFLLEECRKKERNVLFLVTPYSYDEQYQGRIVTLKELVESYGFPLLDLTDGESYGLDYSTDFADYNHVNYVGAQKVTNVLGEYLEKEYNIHAQHTPAVTADWERCAAENREIVRQIEAGNTSVENADAEGGTGEESEEDA